MKPLGVALPICPAIAATHIGKFAWASVSFFQILGLTVTETIRSSQSSSKDYQPSLTALALGSSLILMMSSSFPVVAIGIFGFLVWTLPDDFTKKYTHINLYQSLY
jgi:nitrate reductase NapE component